MLKTLIIIAFTINILIKVKIFRLNKIRFYKNMNKSKYLC